MAYGPSPKTHDAYFTEASRQIQMFERVNTLIHFIELNNLLHSEDISDSSEYLKRLLLPLHESQLAFFEACILKDPKYLTLPISPGDESC